MFRLPELPSTLAYPLHTYSGTITRKPIQRGSPMQPAEQERRNRLSYLALYYAIQGDEPRSEQIRNLIRRMDERQTPLPRREPVLVAAPSLNLAN